MRCWWVCGLVTLLGCGDPQPAAPEGVDAGVDASPEDALDDGGLLDAGDVDDVEQEPDQGGEGEPESPACQGSYAPPSNEGALADPELVEASGIVASRLDPAVLWLHNDSGDEARIFAAGVRGEALGRVRLAGVEARDFEDIAAAPCPVGPPKPCLWIADVGDNLLERTGGVIYVVAEPSVPPNGLGEVEIEPLMRLPISFPGGPVDSEALVVTPDGTGVFLIEKVDAEQARVFAHPGPLQDRVPAVLEEVATFPSPGIPIRGGFMITGADMHPSASRLVLRLYTGTFEYRFGAGEGMASLASLAPVLVAAGPITEKQGESVCYDALGDGIWTVSEDVGGLPGQPLHHYRCVDP